MSELLYNPKSYIGKKINMLTILGVYTKSAKSGKSRTWCLCQCDCGTEKEILWEHIRSGSTKSCGCLAKRLFEQQPLEENTYVNGVLVLEYKGIVDGSKTYFCQCECGNQFTTTASRLSHGYTTSCGCKRKRIAEYGDAARELIIVDGVHKRFFNAAPNANSKTGIRGVCVRGKTGAYIATIQMRKVRWYKDFATLDAAIDAHNDMYNKMLAAAAEGSDALKALVDEALSDKTPP